MDPEEKATFHSSASIPPPHFHFSLSCSDRSRYLAVSFIFFLVIPCLAGNGLVCRAPTAQHSRPPHVHGLRLHSELSKLQVMNGGQVGTQSVQWHERPRQATCQYQAECDENLSTHWYFPRRAFVRKCSLSWPSCGMVDSNMLTRCLSQLQLAEDAITVAH